MRHTTNKRGFTLTEIMIVIAIIVILVSAVSAGIAIDLNRYKNHLASLTTDEGESAWEIAARSEVAGIFGAAASDNAIALASQSAAAESSIAAAGLASQSAAAVKASEAAVSASAAAISDAAASASAAAAPTASASSAAASVAAATTQSSSGGGSHVANTYTSNTAGVNASGSNISTNSNVTHDYTDTWYWTQERGSWSERTYTNTKITTTGNITANSSIEEAIITVPSGTTNITLSNWRYGVSKIDDTHYKVTYTAGISDPGNYQYNPPENSISYTLTEEYSNPDMDGSPSAVYISQYSTSK